MVVALKGECLAMVFAHDSSDAKVKFVGDEKNSSHSAAWSRTSRRSSETPSSYATTVGEQANKNGVRLDLGVV